MGHPGGIDNFTSSIKELRPYAGNHEGHNGRWSRDQWPFGKFNFFSSLFSYPFDLSSFSALGAKVSLGWPAFC